MAKLVNLTPHTINIYLPANTEGADILVIPPSGTVARCEVVREHVDDIYVDIEDEIFESIVSVPIPVNQNQYGEVTGLPDPQPDTYYIVSLVVAQALQGKRDDVLIVDDTVRDAEGRIVGARALARL